MEVLPYGTAVFPGIYVITVFNFRRGRHGGLPSLRPAMMDRHAIPKNPGMTVDVTRTAVPLQGAGRVVYGC
jgi:hypothetical protein